MKTSKDYYKLIEDQLDKVTKSECTEEDIRRADCVSNAIGKSLKLAALQIAYSSAMKKDQKKIDMLE